MRLDKLLANMGYGSRKEVKQLLKEIKTLEISIEDIKEKIKNIEKDIKHAESDLNSSLIELETIEKKIDSERKEENSFYIARMLLKVSEEYKTKQIKNYLTKIADLAVKKFEEINKKDTPVVFLLWGNFAKEKAKYITNPKHLIISSPHPSPFSARNGFFGSKPFSKCNDFLNKNNIKPINW